MMRGVLAVTLQSMQHDMKRVDVVGMNLANALTPGYKRDMVLEIPFTDYLQSTAGKNVSENMPLQTNALSVLADNRVGTLKATGQSLDLALGGKAYFQVQTKEGIAYTRQGNFTLDAQGRLVTSQGYPVLGRTGEIYLKSSNPFIDELGNIRDGNTTQQMGSQGDNILAQIKTVEFKDGNSLQRIGDSLLSATESAEMIDSLSPQIKQAHLENSNVSSMEEMVQLMTTMRHFESMQRITQGYDEMLGMAIKKLGDVS